MSTLFENEYQVQSVIAKYHQEAANANQIAAADRQDSVGARAAGGFSQTLHRLIDRTEVPIRSASTSALRPESTVTILNFPK